MTDRPLHDRSRLVIVLALIVGAMTCVTTATSTYSIVKLSQQADAIEAGQVAIQQERVRNILSSCELLNKRNRDFVVQLDREVARLPPARRRQARGNRASTVRLINALVPVRDCEALVRRQAPSADR